MQQDGVESLRVAEREKLSLLIIGKDRSDSVAQIVCTADSLIGPKFPKAIGWNTYDPDNAAYAACFPDALLLLLLLLLFLRPTSSQL